MKNRSEIVNVANPKEMLNPRELRIGNLIIQEGIDYDSGGNKIGDPEGDEIITVSSAVIFDIENDSIGYKGITLTEEWLVKFGFEYNGMGYHSPDSKIYYNSDHKKLYFVVPSNYNLSNIQYVHQLQNLYFALTGEELELKQEEKK